jgi:uncharacterized membrane protein YphA (DoxX/SURF4 family)
MQIFGTKVRQLPLALLRIAIGWHFLYEGWTKVIAGGWSSATYLNAATGPFAPVFHWMSSSGKLLPIVDQLNVWGLILIGLALILGAFTRMAGLGGMALLAMYYLAYPPFFGYSSGAEGASLIVNKNLVELIALAVVVAFPATELGLDGLRRLRRTSTGDREKSNTRHDGERPSSLGRREIMATLLGLPVIGALTLAVLQKHGWKSFEEMWIRSRPNPNDITIASATASNFTSSSMRDLKAACPHSRIGNMQISRLIIGGNMITGVAHARDLIYVSRLVQAYHTREKIFETLSIAESCGINTIISNSSTSGIINEYWKAGGKIQFVGEGWTPDGGAEKLLPAIQYAIDRGACACYISGVTVDRLIQNQDFDTISRVLELVRKNKLPVGLSAHEIVSLKTCAERGLRPDFWMKTLHPSTYWSASRELQNDNIWCTDLEETVAFMHELPEPFIAYKTLAAGALEPKTGFRFAFENGADIVCAGMYDFQVIENVNATLEILSGGIKRARGWRA